MRKKGETRGQLLYEWEHLKRKLRRRNSELFAASKKIKIPQPHPLFRIIKGEIQEWERANQT